MADFSEADREVVGWRWSCDRQRIYFPGDVAGDRRQGTGAAGFSAALLRQRSGAGEVLWFAVARCGVVSGDENGVALVEGVCFREGAGDGAGGEAGVGNGRERTQGTQKESSNKRGTEGTEANLEMEIETCKMQIDLRLR